MIQQSEGRGQLPWPWEKRDLVNAGAEAFDAEVIVISLVTDTIIVTGLVTVGTVVPLKHGTLNQL